MSEKEPRVGLRAFLLVLIHSIGLVAFLFAILKFGFFQHRGVEGHLASSFEQIDRDLAFVMWALAYLMILFGIGLFLSKFGTWAKDVTERFKAPDNYRQAVFFTITVTILGYGAPLVLALFTVQILGGELAIISYKYPLFAGMGLILFGGAFKLPHQEGNGVALLLFIFSMVVDIGLIFYGYDLLKEEPFKVLIAPYFLLFVTGFQLLTATKKSRLGRYVRDMRAKKQYLRRTLFFSPLILATFGFSCFLAWASLTIVGDDNKHALGYSLLGIAFIFMIGTTFRLTREKLSKEKS